MLPVELINAMAEIGQKLEALTDEVRKRPASAMGEEDEAPGGDPFSSGEEDHFEFRWKQVSFISLQVLHDHWYLGQRRYLAVSASGKRQVIDVGPYRDRSATEITGIVSKEQRKYESKKFSQAKSCVIFIDKIFQAMDIDIHAMEQIEKDQMFVKMFAFVEKQLDTLTIRNKRKSVSKLSFSSFYEHYLLPHLSRLDVSGLTT